jgi:hypothetical protein
LTWEFLFMALESVHLRRSRNAYGLSEERRKEFRKFGIFGPMWAPRARRLKMRQHSSAGVMFSPSFRFRAAVPAERAGAAGNLLSGAACI